MPAVVPSLGSLFVSLHAIGAALHLVDSHIELTGTPAGVGDCTPALLRMVALYLDLGLDFSMQVCDTSTRLHWFAPCHAVHFCDGCCGKRVVAS
jgi:hypothetical protein